MKFDSEIHHRRSIRLQGHDYAEPNVYFVTLCTQGRECTLGQISTGISHLSAAGEAVQQQWLDLPRRFANIRLDTYIIMPNHLHGIIMIHPASPRTSNVGALLAAPNTAASETATPQLTTQGAASSAPTIGDILRAFKSLSAIAANRLLGRTGQPFWQRNYWERVVRNEDELNTLREYVYNNPMNWESDSLNESGKTM